MRQTLRAAILLLSVFFLQTDGPLLGQNLLPNPGFELLSNCPSTYNQWTLLQDWQAGNASTPDYYNCGYYGISVKGDPSQGTGVLGVWGGPQHPSCPASAYVENVRASLLQAMVPGQTYEVSFDVQIDGDGFGSASPNDCIRVGAYFYRSTQAPDLNGNCSPALEPQVYVMGSAVQKGSYQRFSFTVTATDSWDRVLWGTFATDLSGTSSCASYAGNKLYFNLDQLAVSHTQVLAATGLRFDGSVEGQSVLLGWEIDDPQLMQEMVVERRIEGEATFYPLTSVIPFSSQTQYSYRDEQAAAGNNYYRLRLQSKDRGLYYSDVLSLNVNLPLELSLYPNPARENVCLSFNLKRDEIVTIVIKDVRGSIMHEQRQSLRAGEQTLKVPVSNWASGLYLMDLCTDSGRLNAKARFATN